MKLISILIALIRLSCSIKSNPKHATKTTILNTKHQPKRFKIKLKRFLQRQLQYLSTLKHKRELKKQQKQTSRQQQEDQQQTHKYRFQQDIKIGENLIMQVMPYELEAELLDRLQKDIDDDQSVHVFDSSYDLRDSGFSCANDKVEGEMMMIDKVVKDSEVGKSYITFQKVELTVDNHKLVLKENSNVMDIFQLNEVYPKLEMIENIVHSISAFKNLQLQKLKLQTHNITYMSDKEKPMFCLFLIRDSKQEHQQFSDLYSHEQISELVVEKIGVDNGLKMKLLGLCGSSYEYVKKWTIFMNREKIECLVDFNIANYQ